MSSTIPLTKMHGARNDFVILDRRVAHVDSLPSFARRVCERRTGIGADGLIVIEPSNTSDVAMRTINADGSEAEMCGNGVRCAARWLDEAGEGDRVEFETAGGVVRCEVVARAPEYLVRVSMGSPRILPRAPESPDDAVLVDLGNPHVVYFVDDADVVDLATLAERLQTDARFPNGTNVHVAVVEGRGRLRLRHWERGVGLTMACGTGAVACAAAAIDRNLVMSPVEALVPGGRLVVEWDGQGPAALTGPAVRVFDTEVRAQAGAATL
ncbi:MAG: diaminopimelate epimerase [Candidatus Tumulicola sp.]